MSMRLATLIVTLGVLVGGCGSYFAPDRNISDRLDDAAVLGTWYLSARSLALLERDGFRRGTDHRYTVTLNPDRSCAFDSVLDEAKGGSHVTTACTWRLEHDTRGDSNIQKANALRIQFELNGVRQGHYLNFARERSTLILWNYYGDPDAWEFIEYSRSATTTSHRPLQPTSGALGLFER